MSGPGAVGAAPVLPTDFEGVAEMAHRTCSIDGCSRPHKARGWCAAHYGMWQRTGHPGPVVARYRKPDVACSVDGCTARRYCKGFCRNHYQTMLRHGDPLWFDRGCGVDGCERPRAHGDYCSPHAHRYYRYGDPLAGEPERPAGLTTEEKFWRSVHVAGPNECWHWRGDPAPSGGYPQIRIDGKNVLAHRFSYELHKGPIPFDLVVDHACHNRDLTCRSGAECMHRRCVNPAHLEAVTQQENARRAAQQVKGRAA